MVCVGCAALFVLLVTYPFPIPPPQTVTFPIPKGAEVFPAFVVRPGTFSIDEPLEAFLERAAREGGRVIVTYPALPDKPISDGAQEVLFHYWLPRPDGVIYHASHAAPGASSPPTLTRPGYYTERTVARGNKATLFFTARHPNGSLVLGVLLVICVAVSVCWFISRRLEATP